VPSTAAIAPLAPEARISWQTAGGAISNALLERLHTDLKRPPSYGDLEHYTLRAIRE
jgi:hypothetical protein